MEGFWARYVEPSGQLGPVYWDYFAQRLVDLASFPTSTAILDIGTYDGNVLFKAMNKVGGSSCGVGIDIYGKGLLDGRSEAARGGLENVSFAQMDADNQGFPSESFDVVLGNFVGWDYCFDFDRLEFTAPNIRMAEIRRVLTPGGQVGIGTWIIQEDIDWLGDVFRRYLTEKTNGKRIKAYGKENPKGYEIILSNSGFGNICVEIEKTTFLSPDKETWWRQMKQAAKAYFHEMPEIEKFKGQIFKDLTHFQSPKGIQFGKTVAYVFGSRS